jgi:cholest-4-en-3-one 26-monooxygenase
MRTVATMSDAVDLGDIDICSHDSYLDGPPHELYTQLRREAPVYRHKKVEEGQPDFFWALTRHADVVTASRQFQTYSSALKGCTLNEDRPDLEFARMLIDSDPPEHTRLRMLVNRGFTPKSIRPLAEHYEEVSKDLVGKALEKGEIDMVTDLAAELPLIAIAEMMGVPVEDRQRVFEWSNRMIATQDPEYSGGAEDAQGAATELYMYANALGADRRACPRDDIVSTLISAEGSDQLSGMEFELFFLLLAVAGNETTRNAISHGINFLLEFPDAMAELQADMSLIDTAVEEMLRWATPVNQFRRAATCDVELNGVQIKQGESVVMFYASANFDEDVFADPFTFDIHRAPNPHLSFGGGGPHFCLGANLARLELKLLFQELLPRVKRIERTGEVSRLRSNFINGIKHLPVRLVPN